MNEVERLEERERQEVHWRLLRIAGFGGYQRGATDQIAIQVLRGAGIVYSVDRIRDELAYLGDKGLIEFIHRTGVDWRYRLNAKGRDVLGETEPCPEGIAKPEWE